MVHFRNDLYRLTPQHAVLAIETLVALNGRVHKLGQQDFHALLTAVRSMGDYGQVTITTHRAGPAIQWCAELYVSGTLTDGDGYAAFLDLWEDYNGN